jgi:hypothetical protein
MLEKYIRKIKKGTQEKGLNLRSVTAFFIFGAIALVFVLFGLPQDLGGSLSKVASVNGKIISASEFQREQERVKNQYASMFGGAQDLGFQADFFSQQAVESLIRNELVHQYAEKTRVFVSDAEVAKRIIEIPAFQKEGRFQRDYYSNYLSATRQSAFEFETSMKKQIQGIRLRALFEAALHPTDLEVGNIAKLKSIQMNYEFAKFNEDGFFTKNKVSESSVKQLAEDKNQEAVLNDFYSANAKDFKGDFATNKFQVAQKYLAKKKYDEFSKELETAVQEKNVALVTSVLSKYGFKWEETGLVDLSQESIPKLSSSQVNLALVKLDKNNNFYDKVIREGADRYVVRLADVKNVGLPKLATATESQQQLDYIKRRRGDGAFNEWLQDKRKVSNVFVNPGIYSNRTN